MANVIQKLPQILWVYLAPYKVLLTDPHYYVWFWVDGVRKRSVALASAEEALQKVASAEQKGYGAFASGPIPANNNQHGVFAISAAGETKSVFMSKHYKVIEDAKFSVIGKNKVTPVSASVQIIASKPEVKKIANGGKDDIAVMMVECTIDEDPHQKMYTFRTVEALNVGDRRTAKLKSGERKPVTVRNILPPCFASQLDHPLNWYVTLEVFLLAEHQNVGFGIRKPANGVLSEEEMEETQARVEQMKLVV